MTTQISLERIVRLGVPVTWHEAVAVSQQVGRDVNASGIVAGLDTCFLSASGTVEVTGRPRSPFGGEPTLGALQALVNRAQAPRELLDVIDQSGAATFDEINTKLQFFARSDSAALVGALATRALDAEGEAKQQAELDRLRAEVVSHKTAFVPAPSKGRRLMPLALGAAAITAAGVALALAATGSNAPNTAPPSNTSASAPTPAEAPSRMQKITGGFDALVDKGMAALGLSAASPAAPPAEPAKAESARRQPRLARRAPVATETAPLVVILPPEAAGEPPTTYTAEVREETDYMVSPEMVHEAGASNLQPPILRWPQLPQEPESHPIEAGTSYLEILINEGGTVDKVRLRAVRTSFHERMLVSAAKAWVFHPAQKDGRPVKYLMKVPILAQ